MAFGFIFSDVGIGEWFVLLAVVLIVVGPKRLPEAARRFGNAYSKIRRSADAFKRQLLEAGGEIEHAAAEVERELAAPVTGAAPESASGDHPQS